jgi:anti-sigma regulatory factor (Ser/Thr protein kinase)
MTSQNAPSPRGSHADEVRGHLSGWSHETALAPELVSASLARDFIELHLGEHDLAHLSDDVQLVVSELATNALLHAGTPFTVTLRGDGGSVLLVVQDGSSSTPVHDPVSELETRGRGLTLVDALSHDWGVKPGDGSSKSVWASFVTSAVDAGHV